MSSPPTGRCPRCRAHGEIAEPCPTCGGGLRFIPPEDALALAADDPRIGRRVGGRYLIVGTVGAGGFGAVCLALQLPVLMRCALKVIRASASTAGPEGRLLQKKFLDEARALATLSHPNIVRLIDYGVDGADQFLVMELVRDGVGLDDALATAPGQVDHVYGQVLGALEAAHRVGIVHRDIKPANVLVSAVSGDSLHVKVLDFGLARFVDHEATSAVVGGHFFMGTARFMAPEQYSGKPVGPTTDLYAVAVMLFHTMCGAWPFAGESAAELAVERSIPSFDPCAVEAAGALSASARVFFRRALSPEPAARYPDVAAFRVGG